MIMHMVKCPPACPDSPLNLNCDLSSFHLCMQCLQLIYLCLNVWLQRFQLIASEVAILRNPEQIWPQQ